MRTTINLPDEIYDVVRSFAAAKELSLGDAVAELVRKGLRPEKPARKEGFPCFDVPDSAAPITLEQTLAAEDDL
ncbi:MAG: antitoxin [Acidobacteriia bacterium]|nr:antitoxin [Terriglobia bacterium]